MSNKTSGAVDGNFITDTIFPDNVNLYNSIPDIEYSNYAKQVKIFFSSAMSYNDYQKLVANMCKQMLATNITYENLHNICQEALSELNRKDNTSLSFNDNLLRMTISNKMIEGKTPKNYVYTKSD